MTTIDPKVKIEKLLTKAGAGPSKKSRTTRKPEIIIPRKTVKEMMTLTSSKAKVDDIVSKDVVKPVEPVVTEPTSVTIPLKTGVFHKLKLNYGGSPTSNVVLKPHLTHQGSQADMGGGSSTSNFEMDALMKDFLGQNDESSVWNDQRLRIQNPGED
ncbi:unnamed protein product [Lactuca saligna]|uniref:Uncharacterized protein n=1 Tax=Lactuca saligna TaxID=75948 RepID=A0AA35Z9W0_LACSI|nr:unnamed protein product [Lactuca saligna]